MSDQVNEISKKLFGKNTECSTAKLDVVDDLDKEMIDWLVESHKNWLKRKDIFVI